MIGKRIDMKNRFGILPMLVLLFCPYLVQSFILSPSAVQAMPIPSPKIDEQPQPALQPQNCTQAYPRLFFTPNPNQMLIKFTTIHPCNRSFVTINQNNSISKYYCNPIQLKIQQNTTYIRYMQNCLVTIRTDLMEFNYTVYGQGITERILGSSSNMFKINIPQKGTNLNLIVTADWGPIRVRTYQPIYPSLIRQIHQGQRIYHALLIVGDVSYDESDRQCQQYELFMTQLSVVSPYLPIIPISGNHEGRNPNNYQIFKKTFECYNHTEKARVQAYHFWNFKLVTFDPFLQIYNKSNPESYQTMRANIFKQLAPNEKKNDFTILSSHYPVICSQEVFHCKQTLLVMPELYREFSNSGQVDLYLGAHMHQYERIVSFQNGSFLQKRQGPYGRGQMPSIVEGVGGCDLGIIDQEYPTEYYSVAHTYNRTGYGVLMVSNLTQQPKVEYIHYITPTSTQTQIFDRVIIDPSSPKFEQAQVRQE